MVLRSLRAGSARQRVRLGHIPALAALLVFLVASKLSPEAVALQLLPRPLAVLAASTSWRMAGN